MEENITQETGWRGSEEIWLETAYQALIESGIDAVRIQPLAKTLNLSRTSFYWFFKDREALLSTLIERWRDKNTGNLIRQAETYAETVGEAVLNVFDCWLDTALFDSRLEFAMRGWALQSRDVSAEIESADKERLGALTALFARFGCERELADVRARTLYLVQIGYISMKIDEPLEVRMRRIPAYIETFTGKPAEERALQRFYARHGYLSE